MINEYIDILHIFVGWCGRYIEVYKHHTKKAYMYLWDDVVYNKVYGTIYIHYYIHRGLDMLGVFVPVSPT